MYVCDGALRSHSEGSGPVLEQHTSTGEDLTGIRGGGVLGYEGAATDADAPRAPALPNDTAPGQEGGQRHGAASGTHTLLPSHLRGVRAAVACRGYRVRPRGIWGIFSPSFLSAGLI